MENITTGELVVGGYAYYNIIRKYTKIFSTTFIIEAKILNKLPINHA